MPDERLTSFPPPAVNSPQGKDPLAVAWNSVTGNQKIIGAGVLCLALLAFYVPWTHTYSGREGIHSEKPAGYYFIFNPPQPEKEVSPLYGVKIDVPRVVIPMAVVVGAMIAAVVFTGMKTRKQGEPVA